jgi:hypothetical protein
MSGPFDYNGFSVSKSYPKKTLKSVKKTVLIDSADRDTTKYFTNGDFVVYLPRVYENVVSMRLVAAEFPPTVVTSGSPGAVIHKITDGLNVSASGWTNDQTLTSQFPNTYYFILDIEGLNKVDETTVGSLKSTFSDSFYAKIPALTTTYGAQSFIEYNDHSGQENIARFSPAINKLDRLHIRTRIHSQQDRGAFIYWTTDGAKATIGGTTQKGAEFNLTLEIEMLDNVFDDFSSLETHLRDRN